MTLSTLIAKLKADSLSLYLSKSEAYYFNTPELFSPLYRNFINALLDGKEPAYYQDNFLTLCSDTKIKLIGDISYKDGGAIFDRYLLCLYPSPYEASNPRQLSDSELNEKSLLKYLQKEYFRPSTAHDSIKLSREIDYILELVTWSTEFSHPS